MELYVDRDSWLHRLDPRTKLAFTVTGAVLLLLTSNLPVVLAWLIVTHAALLSAGVPGSKVRWAWKLMLPLMIMIPVLWPLFYQEGPTVLLQVGPVRITELSLLRGVAVALRINALAFVWFVLLFTTDQARLIRGLVRLGLPYSWGLTAAIALRYLPALQEAYTTVSDAQQARGLVLRGHFLAAARAQLPILVAMLIGALRTTDQLALALQARAYNPRRPRTSYRELALAPVDTALLVGIGVAALLYLYARLALGFAVHPLSPW